MLALTECTEFEDKFKEYLGAIINLIIDEDTNILIIRTLTPVLKATADANLPCSDKEKDNLKAETEANAEGASTALAVYSQEKDQVIEDIVDQAKTALLKIEKANAELLSFGLATIPAATIEFDLPPSEVKTAKLQGVPEKASP